MPHLAPLKWFLLTTFFWMVLLSAMSMIWWQTAPQIAPFTSAFTKMTPPTWPWS